MRALRLWPPPLPSNIARTTYLAMFGAGTTVGRAALSGPLGSMIAQPERMKRRHVAFDWRLVGCDEPGIVLDPSDYSSGCCSDDFATDCDGTVRSVLPAQDQVQNGKPEPDIYLEAARRLNVNPAMCVAVEDSNAGVLAATRAGMRTFIVPDVERPPSVEARAAAFEVVPSLHEVAAVISRWLS